MNTRFITGLTLLGCSLGSLISVAPAHAQFLVGAELFAGDGSGASASNQYQYDTNTNSSSGALSINGGGKSISFALSPGANAFSFDQTVNVAHSSTGSTGVLGLFFSATNTPFNPSTTARTPDLPVYAPTNTSSVLIPVAGSLENNYFFGTSGSPLVAANGATTYTVGGTTIAISSYSVANKPSGTFTVNVTPVATPEPGSIALLSGLGLSGGVFALRRRRRK